MVKLVFGFSFFVLSALCCDQKIGLKTAHGLVLALADSYGAEMYTAGPHLLRYDDDFYRIPYALYFRNGDIELGDMLVNKEMCYSTVGSFRRTMQSKVPIVAP